jgi:hypothetical protein
LIAPQRLALLLLLLLPLPLLPRPRPLRWLLEQLSHYILDCTSTAAHGR